MLPTLLTSFLACTLVAQVEWPLLGLLPMTGPGGCATDWAVASAGAKQGELKVLQEAAKAALSAAGYQA